jgi:hypothetical protein
MDTIYLINNIFINNSEIIKRLEKVAQSNGVVFKNHSDEDYVQLYFSTPVDENEIQLFRSFTLMMDGEVRFNQTKRDKSVIEGYGIIGYVNFDYDDKNLFNILKQLVNEYPDILVYNELGNASPEHPFVFSKAHFEIAKDLYSLNQPPLQ